MSSLRSSIKPYSYAIHSFTRNCTISSSSYRNYYLFAYKFVVLCVICKQWSTKKGCKHRKFSWYVLNLNSLNFYFYYSIFIACRYCLFDIFFIKSWSLDFCFYSTFMVPSSNRSGNFFHGRTRYICSNIDFILRRIFYDTFISTSVPYTVRLISTLTILASIADNIVISIEWISYIRI